MNSLEKWLEDRTTEVKKREEDGFPEDVDGEIKWNKVSFRALMTTTINKNLLHPQPSLFCLRLMLFGVFLS